MNTAPIVSHDEIEQLVQKTLAQKRREKQTAREKHEKEEVERRRKLSRLQGKTCGLLAEISVQLQRVLEHSPTLLKILREKTNEQFTYGTSTKAMTLLGVAQNNPYFVSLCIVRSTSPHECWSVDLLQGMQNGQAGLESMEKHWFTRLPGDFTTQLAALCRTETLVGKIADASIKSP